MGVPEAADPTNPVPGLALTVDLLASTTSPGTVGLTALIVAPKNTTGGDMTANTEVRDSFTLGDTETAMGVGSLGALCHQALLANDPEAAVTLLAPTESAGAAAAGTLVFAGTLTTDKECDIYVSGYLMQMTWFVGETPDNAVTKAVALINAAKRYHFATATDAVAAGTVDMTANGKGPAGNDVILRVVTRGGTGGTLTVNGGSLSVGNLSGGSTEPDFTTALTTVEGRAFTFIGLCISNADAQASGGSTNHARLETHIDALDQGLSAKLQFGVVASTGSDASAKTGAIARNSCVMEHVHWRNAQSLPCEFVGAEIGDFMRRLRTNKNPNRTLTKLRGVRGTWDITADAPTAAEARSCLENGVSEGGYNAVNELVLLRPITTHSVDDFGNPDRRCFDSNEVLALFAYAAGLRTTLQQTYQGEGDQKPKIVKNRKPTDKRLPKNVVEERDILATIVSETRGFWVPEGVIDGDKFDEDLAGGRVIVEVNATDPTQVDIFIPAAAFKILAKIGLYVAKAA